MSRMDSAPTPLSPGDSGRQTEDSARPTGHAQAWPLVDAGQCPAGGMSSLCQAAPCRAL